MLSLNNESATVVTREIVGMLRAIRNSIFGSRN